MLFHLRDAVHQFFELLFSPRDVSSILTEEQTAGDMGSVFLPVILDFDSLCRLLLDSAPCSHSQARFP